MTDSWSVRRRLRELRNRRWQQVSSLSPLWADRSQLAASWIEPDSSIVEFGAGQARLLDFLPLGSTYVPTDIVRRERVTQIVDLNAPAAYPSGFDVAVLLGVLEYTERMDLVIDRLRAVAPTLIFTYCFPIRRRSLRQAWTGWHDLMTVGDVLGCLEASGFEVTRASRIEVCRGYHQYLVRAESVGKHDPGSR